MSVTTTTSRKGGDKELDGLKPLLDRVGNPAALFFVSNQHTERSLADSVDPAKHRVSHRLDMKLIDSSDNVRLTTNEYDLIPLRSPRHHLRRIRSLPRPPGRPRKGCLL